MLIGSALTAQLICVFAFAYAKIRFSHDQSCIVFLTHISLGSFLWYTGKQYSLRCDAADRGFPSETILFA